MFLTTCVDCGAEFETFGRNPYGVDPVEFVYTLNWRCGGCRDPKAVESGRKRQQAMVAATKRKAAERQAQRAAELDVADLL